MVSRFDATPRRLIIHVVALLLVVSATRATPAAAQAAWPTVRLGHAGPNVTTVQYLLRHHGYPVAVDGSFGPATERHIKAFEQAHRLEVNGIVGPDTWSQLSVELDYGAQGAAVKALQVQLKKHGYAGFEVGGTYGSRTRDAVVAFKRTQGLSSSTLVGPLTWQALTGSRTASSGYALPLPKSALPRGEYDDPHHDYPAVDLPVRTGTRVYAMRSGTVSYFGGTCGLGIVITADDGALYRYCHFNSRTVAPGARVQTGQFLGYSGNTGNSMGPHLHLDIRYGGVQRCPQRMLLALYDGTAVPHPATLPTSGCTFA